MQKLSNLIIEGSKQKPIAIDVFYKKTSVPKPIVIFSHGFKGFKDWGHFNLVAETFAEAGFVFIKFNFSYNGTTPENPIEFGDLDAFGNNNYLIELNDLQKVIDWTFSFDTIKNEIDPEQLFLLGHSRGGAITILKAGEEPRVKKIVTWASVSDIVSRNNQSTVSNWRETGVVHTFNGRTKQQMPLSYQFYEVIQANKERLNILKNAGQLTIPFLIIHGDADEAVSVNDAKELKKASKNSTLVVLAGANHTFGAKHPFEEKLLPTDAALAVAKTVDFLKAE